MLISFVLTSFCFCPIVSPTSHLGIKVRAYCPVGESDKGRFALNVAVKSLDLFKK